MSVIRIFPNPAELGLADIPRNATTVRDSATTLRVIRKRKREAQVGESLSANLPFPPFSPEVCQQLQKADDGVDG